MTEYRHNNEESKGRHFAERMAVSFGCGFVVAGLAILGFTGIDQLAQEAQRRREEDAAIERPVITGTIVREATIPSDISERARREYPYWVLVETQDGLLKLNFDTDDPFYEPGDEHRTERRGIQLEIGISTGENYKNKALDLDGMLNVGDRISFRTREQTGIERQVYELVRLENGAGIADVDSTVEPE